MLETAIRIAKLSAGAAVFGMRQQVARHLPDGVVHRLSIRVQQKNEIRA